MLGMLHIPHGTGYGNFSTTNASWEALVGLMAYAKKTQMDLRLALVRSVINLWILSFFPAGVTIV